MIDYCCSNQQLGTTIDDWSTEDVEGYKIIMLGGEDESEVPTK
jgi:hypothetical protein